MTIQVDCDVALALSDLPREVVLDGHRVIVSEVFWTYWYLAAERQAVYFRRTAGLKPPWTNDAVLSGYRFTNAYRAADRVSQYLLHRVIYDSDRSERDVILRVLLFKVFNRIATWEDLVDSVGEPTVATFDVDQYARVLDARMGEGERVYSAAYIMPSPQMGCERKHRNHLELLAFLIRSGTVDRLASADSLAELYRKLRGIPSFGPFLAFQFAIDLNYSEAFDFDENDYVEAGPGALRGIEKCFVSTGGLTATEIIRAMTNAAPEYLETVEPKFHDLWGRSLHLIDCQNLFCEVDKYARAFHPHVTFGGPTRIKQTFSAESRPLPVGFPPKWGLEHSARSPWRVSEILT